MTTLGSLPAAVSGMDDGDSNGRRRHRSRRLQTLKKPNSFNAATVTTFDTRSCAADNGSFQGDCCAGGLGEEDDGNCQEGNSEVWGNFTDNFRQVQSVLDRNRALIRQVNENHQSKIHDNMVKNVALIQEINGNISKVVSLYSNLSTNFSSLFHEPNASVEEEDSHGKASG